MGAPGGYAVHPGLFRVPDQLTEEQFVAYMRNTYGVKVEFTYLSGDDDDLELSREEAGASVDPSRALGISDNERPAVDPALAAYNSRTLPAAYDTTPRDPSVAVEAKEEPGSKTVQENTKQSSSSKSSTSSTTKR